MITSRRMTWRWITRYSTRYEPESGKTLIIDFMNATRVRGCPRIRVILEGVGHIAVESGTRILEVI